MHSEKYEKYKEMYINYDGAVKKIFPFFRLDTDGIRLLSNFLQVCPICVHI